MDRIFISYSSCDRNIADQLLHYLEDRGIPCWISFRDITSGNFSGEITRALRAADIVLVICSTQSCRSEHVKNEVSLAFNQKKHIIPYLLEENPFDDDLEYFLSLKQHIKTRGSQDKDFPLIEKFIHDYRGDWADATTPAAPLVPEPAAPAKKKSALPIILSVVGILAAGGGAYFLLNRPKEAQPVAQEQPAVQVQEQPVVQVQEQPVAKAQEQPKTAAPKTAAPKANTPAPAASASTNTFSGTVVNGYPDGFGTYTFKTRRRIDMHDAEERYAEPGDYIKGDWRDGHLNYGEWYDAQGNKKAFIRLGDNPDTGSDQKLGKCAKR